MRVAAIDDRPVALPTRPVASLSAGFLSNMAEKARKEEMPDAATKATVFFEAQGGTAPTGWTETFYSAQADPAALAASMIATYCPARKELLGLGASLQCVRTSKIPPNRVTFLTFITGLKDGISQTFTSAPGDAYDPTQVDVLCRMNDATGHRRQFWMGGLPDSQTDQLIQQGVTQGGFLVSPLFKAWVKAINTLQLGIRWKSAVGPPALYTFGQITTIQPIMVRNRKRGRPFFLFRGRRLA